MRVLLEFGINLSGKRGISVLQDNLIRQLAKIDRENEFLLFCYFFTDYERKLGDWFGDIPRQPNIRLCVKRWPERGVRFLEERLGLPVRRWYFEREGVDVYHSFGWFHPEFRNIRTVVTVQDTPFLHPEFVPGYPWARESVARQLRSADRIIAVSETTKGELTEAFGLAESRIAAVPYGMDFEVFRPRERGDLEPLRKKYGLPDRYLLGMGPFAVRDNPETLLRAFAQVCETPEYCGHRLVLVGGVDSGAPVDLEGMIGRSGLAERVVRLGYVPGQSPELAGVYSCSDALVFLSSLEGIGIPPLEAMATGTPVVASSRSAVPEFVGNAGLLVDPRDPEAVAGALLALARDPALRKENIRRGLERVRQWTWERTARDTLAAWRQALAGS